MSRKEERNKESEKKEEQRIVNLQKGKELFSVVLQGTQECTKTQIFILVFIFTFPLTANFQLPTSNFQLGTASGIQNQEDFWFLE